MSHHMDNVINWLFEKMFDQITSNAADLWTTPFAIIHDRTFGHAKIHQIIHKLTGRSLETVIEIVSNVEFQDKFLFNKMVSKLAVAVLRNNMQQVHYFLTCFVKVTPEIVKLAIINHHNEIALKLLEYLAKSNVTGDLMYCACEYGNLEVYNELKRHGLMANLSCYHRAASANCLEIIQDINLDVAVNRDVLDTAFKSGNSEIILYLLELAEQDNIKIDPNSVSYLIMQNKSDLIRNLENKNLFQWHHELYYSALLSGCMEMVLYVESKIPDLHDHPRITDSSQSEKARGQKSLLLDDMIYETESHKYFSHTVNYAIQSDSLDVLKHVVGLGYGITISNFITAINQSSVTVLEYICQNYYGRNTRLPHHITCYFSIASKIHEKIAKADVLQRYGLYDFSEIPNMTMNDYRNENVHFNIISNQTHIPEDNFYDADSLLKWLELFKITSGNHVNHRLLTRIRMCLEFNAMHPERECFVTMLQNCYFHQCYNDADQQLLIDVLYLVGTPSQIKLFHQNDHFKKKSPNSVFVMELACYNQISKLCFLHSMKLLTSVIVRQLCGLGVMLMDAQLITFLKFVTTQLKITPPVCTLQQILMTQNADIAREWLEFNGNTMISKNNFKELAKLDDHELIKMTTIPQELYPELFEWSLEAGLVAISDVLLDLMD